MTSIFGIQVFYEEDGGEFEFAKSREKYAGA
jgi:hypothetical protein